MLNLRGRIVTAIEMRNRLDVKPREDGSAPMAIGIEARGESFGLLVDAVGEVLKLPDAERESNPVNLDRKLAAFAVRRLSARRSASCRARRRSGARSACRGGGMNNVRLPSGRPDAREFGSGFARAGQSEDS